MLQLKQVMNLGTWLPSDELEVVVSRSNNDSLS